jgi:hypothetical protein
VLWSYLSIASWSLGILAGPEAGSLTLFEYVVKIWHTLNVCPGHILVLPKDRFNFTAEFVQHIRVSYKKTASELVLATTLIIDM